MRTYNEITQILRDGDWFPSTHSIHCDIHQYLTGEVVAYYNVPKYASNLLAVIHIVEKMYTNNNIAYAWEIFGCDQRYTGTINYRPSVGKEKNYTHDANQPHIALLLALLELVDYNRTHGDDND